MLDLAYHDNHYGAVLSFVFDPIQVVNTNPFGRLLYILVKRYSVIHLYVVKIISNTRTTVNN